MFITIYTVYLMKIQKAHSHYGFEVDPKGEGGHALTVRATLNCDIEDQEKIISQLVHYCHHKL